MGFSIVKKFKFDAAHRIRVQDLSKYKDTVFETKNTTEKCKRIHGHETIIEVCLGAAELEDDMVIDFTCMTWFKSYIDENFDHKFLVDKNDLDLIQDKNSILHDSITTLDFVPTAENLAQHFYFLWDKNLIDADLNGRITVKWVRVHETSNAYAEFCL